MEKLKSLVHHSKHGRKASLAQFRQWVVAFVVCNFNVDVGPEIEIVYPAGTEFTTSDLSAICFNSFPERHEPETTSDLMFNFTVGNNSPEIALGSPHAPHGNPNYFFGSCVFRQEYDHSMKRSFNQRSLTLISNHNIPAFFLALLKQLTASGLISDPSALEAAYSQISKWPAPSVGRHELPFMGTVLDLEIAPHYAFPLQGLSSSAPRTFMEHKLVPVYAYEPTGAWSSLLQCMPSISDLYSVYESILLCESVIVMSKSPQLCSEFISAAVDLSRPVPYAGDVRPYMTMQSDFQSIGLDGGIPRPFVIGITNPFVLRRIMDTAQGRERGPPSIVYLDGNSDQVPIKRHPSQSGRPHAGFDFPGTTGPYFPRRSYIKPDRVFLQSLSLMLAQPPSSANEDITSAIRRHFAELTAQFLSPFNRFLTASVSPNVTTQGGNFRYANFSRTNFLHSLSKHGTAVKFRGQNPLQRHKARDNLYEKFCESLNWHSWLDMKICLEKEASAGLLNTQSTSAQDP